MPEATINVSPDYYGGHEPGPAEAERNADIEARASSRISEARNRAFKLQTEAQRLLSAATALEGFLINKAFAQVEAHLDRQPVEKSVFEERNFIGRSRENVRKAGQKSLFLAAKKAELDALKKNRPDEYDIITPIARSIRTVSDELARLEMSFNDIGPEFDEFSKDLKEDIARRRAEAMAAFDAEEAAVTEYATKFKSERKTLAAEMRKATEGVK